jgi:Mor family transcriptional regulator
MPYVNADELLPPELLTEVQKYLPGGLLYIPCPPQARRSWGLKNGTKRRYEARNAEIRALKAQGQTIDALADRYCLSPDAIRKVLYRRSS